MTEQEALNILKKAAPFFEPIIGIEYSTVFVFFKDFTSNLVNTYCVTKDDSKAKIYIPTLVPPEELKNGGRKFKL